jgi:hypothetical protein
MMISQHLGFYRILILWLLWPVFKVLDQSSGSGQLFHLSKYLKIFIPLRDPTPQAYPGTTFGCLCTFTIYLPFVNSSDFHLSYLNRTQAVNEQIGQIHAFIHSFIPLAFAKSYDSLLFSGASSIPLCYIPFLPPFSTN